MDFTGMKIEEVEFTTSYPNRNGKGFTFLTIVKLKDGPRAMIWSPYIERLDTNVSINEECNEVRGRYNCPVGSILYSRYVEIGGAVYASQTMENGCYFKIFYLDECDMKKKISKEEIEKLFNCQVVD